jgi:hypothetical protein
LALAEADGFDPQSAAVNARNAYVVTGWGGIMSSKDGVHFERTLSHDMIEP